jgi:GAF domain-containing protein
MRFRNRLIVLFLLVGLIPFALMGFVGAQFTRSLTISVQTVREQTVGKYIEHDIQARASTLVQQIQQYAVNHPEKSMEDRFTLPSNSDLALISATSIGQHGYSFVYDLETMVIFHPNPEMVRQSLFQRSTTQPDLWRVISASLTSTGAVQGYYNETISGQTRQMYLVVQRVPNTNLWGGVTVDVDEFLADSTGQIRQVESQINRIIFAYITLFILLGLVVLGYAVYFGGRLATPVEWMAETTTQLMRYLETISRGVQTPTVKDEIKYLGTSLGLLSKQLRAQVSNLEDLVRERTAQLARRTNQVELAAQVARESAEILDVDELLDQTTTLISERFGFYHVGIFLVDQAGEFALLQSSNSEGGRRMLSRQHKLRIGQGVVGFVAAKGEPRIVLDVGADAIHFKNPDLPYTRSEMALAMRVRGRVVGVLDVQSTDPNAYAEEDTRILQVLADQLALAIDNARLYNQSQRTLQELEVAYGQQARQSWQRRLENNMLVYTYDRSGVQVHELPGNMGPETIPLEPKVSLVDGYYHLYVPLLLRNQPLGTVELRREADQSPWSQEEIQVVSDSVSQIAAMLENARLLEEIARRARQESVISQVSSKVQASLDMETVLSAAVREISLALSASRVEIDLAPVRQLSSQGLHSAISQS